LGESCDSQKCQASHVEFIPSEKVVNPSDTNDGEHAAESSVTELATLVQCNHFFAKVLTTLLVEAGVKDAVGLRHIEWVGEVLEHFVDLLIIIIKAEKII